LQRAARTCELAGFGKVAQVEGDLIEWNYGEYEGRRRTRYSGGTAAWQLFRDGCPGGETPQQVGRGLDRVIGQLRILHGNTLLFLERALLRVLAARWLGLEPGLAGFSCSHGQPERFELRTRSVGTGNKPVGTTLDTWSTDRNQIIQKNRKKRGYGKHKT